MGNAPSTDYRSGPGVGSPLTRILLVLGGLASLFGCLLVLGAIAEDVHEQEATALDATATPLLHGLSSPALDAVMRLITDLGSTLVLAVLFVLVLLVLTVIKRRREALLLAVSMGGSLVLNQFLKVIFHRPRPQLTWAHVQPDYSFPSGHAMNSLAFYVATALIVWVIWGRRAGVASVVLAVVLALMVGTSRIYLGYHYLTDVAGGLVAGAAWLLIVCGAFGGGFWLHRWRSEVHSPHQASHE